MVRHSGFFILSVPVAVAVTAFTVGGHSAAIQKSAESSEVQILPVPESDRDSRFHNNGEKAIAPDDVLVTVVPGPLRRNSRVVVGSLDLSGRPHIVTVEWATDESSSAGLGESATRFVSSDEADQITCRASTKQEPSRDPMLVCRQIVTHSKPPVESHSSSPPSPSRLFLVPHFDSTGTVQQVAEAALMASDGHVAVYADNYHLLSASGQRNPVDLVDIAATADRILHILDSELMDFVRKCVGPIADLDGDGRLSIVITDLDRQADTTHIPVRGCVRDQDFLEHGDVDFTGDIVYLHHSLPNGPEFAAMLAHELTHAAVLSRMRALHVVNPAAQPKPIPPWLNEAIAHWVELKITGTPEAFSHRIDLFRSNPAGNPIVTHDAYLSKTTRRGGCRAAGALFLQSFVSHPDELALLLDETTPFDERIKTINGSEFADVFRIWTLSQANAAKTESLSDSVLTPSMSPQHQTIQRKISRRIYGTAFLVLQCDAAMPQLQITSDPASQLQVTVVEP